MQRKLLGLLGIVSQRLAVVAFFAPFLLAGVFLLVLPTAGLGQSLPNFSVDQLQQLQRLGQQGTQSTTMTPNLPPAMTLQPAVPARAAILPDSRLEQIMSARAGARLHQFGYDQFGRSNMVPVPQTGAVQDDYLLGPGDEIVVSLRGQESANGEYRALVDRNGQVVLPRLPPIAASGRTFGSFSQDLIAAVQRAYVATTASISVGRMRQINVLVSGEVNVPGQRQLTGLNSALDAVLLSGGVKKTGSLRNIRIQRGGRVYNVDLYNALTNAGGSSTMRLTDGDRVLVPPLGPTVAVSGLLRNPGIYELPPRASSMPVRTLISLAGGPEVRARYRYSKVQLLPDGRTSLVELPNDSGTVQDGEILFVQLVADQTVSQGTLSGGTSLAGGFPIVEGTKLSQVVRSPGALGQAPYSLFGLIVRRDPVTLVRSLIPFTPSAVLRGGEDMQLQGDDVIRPLSATEAQMLGYVVHAYLTSLAGNQKAIRNPLSQAVDSTTAPTNMLATQTAEASDEIQDIGSIPVDIQRREIIALLDVADPASDRARRQVRLQRERAEQGGSQPGTQQTQQQPANAAAPPGIANTQVYPGTYDDQYDGYDGQNADLGADNLSNSTGRQRDPRLRSRADADLQDHFGEERPNGAVRSTTDREVWNFGALARQLGIDPLILVNFLIDHRAQVNGAVRGGGYYFVGPNASLADLLQVAGGTVNWANERGVELISTAAIRQTGQSSTQRRVLPLNEGLLASYIVQPRDQFRFPQTFTDVGIGSVSVQGEVRYQGNYSIVRGDHLSDLLARAGGLTGSAYPYGTVFLRKSAAQSEREGYERAANEIQNQLVVAMTRVGNDKIDPAVFTSMQVFVGELRNQRALGRISIQADPSVLAASPALDPLLESGDVVYIPPRPSTVTVLGQVMQPGNYAYRAGLTLRDYVAQAGGYSRLADNGETFVILPDGTARKVETSWLHFAATDVLPPGSSIVVPRDVTPLDLRQSILDVTQIMSQLAVTIASVAVLSK